MLRCDCPGNVYHHITAVDAFNRSVVASEPGGRLAIIDLEDRRGGQIPHGVPPIAADMASRGIVVEELKAAASLTSERLKMATGEPTFLALFRK